MQVVEVEQQIQLHRLQAEQAEAAQVAVIAPASMQ
jgi:hypothetical protein